MIPASHITQNDSRTDSHRKSSKADEPNRIKRLERLLLERIRGEVRFDAGTRALYASDGSNYRQVPVGVVLPRDAEDVVHAFRVAADHDIPILSRGGGTSLAGQCVNVALVLDYSKYMNEVEEIDVENRLATVLPGTNLDALRARAEEHGLTFGPDPSTHTHCTLGGMIGNNSCGVHAVLSEFFGPGPRTEDNVHELEVLTYDGSRFTVGPTPDDELARIIQAGGRRGTIYERLRDLVEEYEEQIRAGFPDVPRRVSGFNLPPLLRENGFNVAKALVGTEGTCVAILRAKLHLVPHKKERVLVIVGYPSVFEAGDDIEFVRKFKPIGCEGLDQKLVGYMRDKQLHVDELGYLPAGHGWLLVEFGDDELNGAVSQAERFCREMSKHVPDRSLRIYKSKEEQQHLWKIRESGLGATAFVPDMPDTFPGWEDAAVPPARIGEYLRRFEKLLKDHGYDAALYGHFAQGCVHCRIDFDLKTEQGLENYRNFTRNAADLVVEMGGSISGEHGDGQARGDLLPRMYTKELMGAFRRFRGIWDPRGKMNPGKVIDADSRTTHLRLGPDTKLSEPRTRFRFDEDDGSFAHATTRCVGVGKCRREEGGTMCPSYMVTREERHSTRGRAHLLFEMLHGDLLKEGFLQDEVKESLDLCLSCKGCTSDCPVSVDIPTYKAEFFSKYYAGRLRPREQYAFGLIHRWARLGSIAPSWVNWLSSTPGTAQLMKLAANVAPQRQMPEFARHTFREWFRKRSSTGPDGPKVLLWPDTFNDHFHPQTLVAATYVLEEAGYQVTIPKTRLCCGRALYDHGMLDQAESLWHQTLDSLAPEIAAGTPIIGVEPSCVAAFRDELVTLIGGDQAIRLRDQVQTLPEFLVEDDQFKPPKVGEKILWQPHCHQKATVGLDPEYRLFSRMDIEVSVPNDSCCGMAGAFGFAKEKYEVSQAVGERKLFPALRQNRGTTVVADGFSCREQIKQSSGSLPVHSAELLALALRSKDRGGETAHPGKGAISPQAVGDSPRSVMLQTHDQSPRKLRLLWQVLLTSLCTLLLVLLARFFT